MPSTRPHYLLTVIALLFSLQASGQGVIASGAGLREVLPFSGLTIQAAVGLAR